MRKWPKQKWTGERGRTLLDLLERQHLGLRAAAPHTPRHLTSQRYMYHTAHRDDTAGGVNARRGGCQRGIGAQTQRPGILGRNTHYSPSFAKPIRDSVIALSTQWYQVDVTLKRSGQK